MNEVAFEVLLVDAQSSTEVEGLRKLILTAALRGEFDAPSERQSQLCDALRKIESSSTLQKTHRPPQRRCPTETEVADGSSVLLAVDSFVVNLGDVATIEKGKTGIKDAQPGEYPMVVTAEGRLSADHFDFEGPAVIIPLVSSTGHGDASLKRIHYQDGKYAVGSILCVVQSRYPDLVHPRYLYEYLAAFKDELLVSRMSGTANVSLNVGRVAEIPVPLITYVAQEKLERLMSLCDALSDKARLEATQHAQLVATLLGTLTAASGAGASEASAPTPGEPADPLRARWQRIAPHFDLLLDRPEAVDALEQTILQLAVRGHLVPQDPQDEPAAEFLEMLWMKPERQQSKDAKHVLFQSEAEDLPVGWCIASVAAVADCLDFMRKPVKKDDRQSPSATVPYYGANGQVGWIDEFLFDEDLVLVVEDETFIGRTKPFSYIVQGKSWVNNHAHVLRPVVGVSAEYLNLCLQRYDFIPLTSGTTNRRKLTKGGLLDAQFLFAPLVEQSRIVARVASLRALCLELRQRLTTARTQQALLAQALVQEVA